jgi:hypothetical protein
MFFWTGILQNAKDKAYKNSGTDKNLTQHPTSTVSY